MRILFLTTILPYPPDSGLKIKTYKIIKLLGKNHQLHLVSFANDRSNLFQEKNLKPYCLTVKTFIKPIVSKNDINLYLKLLLSIIFTKSYIIYKFFHREVAKYINNFLKNNEIDIIYTDHIHMAQYIPYWFKGKLVYDEHEILYYAYLSYRKMERNIIKKLFLLFEGKRLETYEKKWLPKFDYIFTISKLDKDRIIKMGINQTKVTFLSIPSETKNSLNINIKRPIVSFIATLSWWPNRQGIRWFIENVFPLIKEKIPDIQLLIAGADENEILKKYSNVSNIKYLGYLKDLIKLYEKTSVIVVPILSGGGIRIKILDALSHGIPVVSTSIGAEGIDVINNREILIADTPDDFSKAVIMLLRNKALALKLSNNSLIFIHKNYNQKKAKDTINIIEKMKN